METEKREKITVRGRVELMVKPPRIKRPVDDSSGFLPGSRELPRNAHCERNLRYSRGREHCLRLFVFARIYFWMGRGGGETKVLNADAR